MCQRCDVSGLIPSWPHLHGVSQVGGFPAVVWGGALRMCWVWHITWFVNSASHCWGYQVSRNWRRGRVSWKSLV